MAQLTFDELVQGLFNAMLGTGDFDAERYSDLLGRLERWVSRRYPGVQSSVEDVAATGVAALNRGAKTGSTSVDGAAAYLMASTRNAAIDALRVSERSPLGGFAESEATEEDPFGVLLDQIVSGDCVRRALDAALRWRRPDGGTGDDLAARVLATYLDLAADDRSPSSREVARGAGLRHVTVLRVYAQIRAFLENEAVGWVPRRALRRG